MPRGHWLPDPSYTLHHAAVAGSVELTHVLLSNGPVDIDHGDPNRKGRTPLMLASHNGYSRVVRVLLNNGASVSAVDDEGYTALLHSAQYGYLAVTKMLLKAGADPTAATSRHGNTPLHLAAYAGHSTLMKTLIEAGVNVDSHTLSGTTPLFFAAGEGHVDAIKVLLDANANPQLTEAQNDCKTRTPYVPLDVAAQSGHSAVVRELIQQRGIDGCGGASRGLEALRLAAEHQCIDIMAMLTDAGVVDTGIALSHSTRHGLEASTKFLLQQQNGNTASGVEYVNNSGGDALTFGPPPLLSSIVSSCPRVVRLLVDAGADTTSPILLEDGENGGVLFQGTPLAFTTQCLLEMNFAERKFTDKDLHRLEAIRRLLLRVEAVRAVSWLWPSDVRATPHTAEGTTAQTKTAFVPLRTMLPILRRRYRRRDVLLVAVFRWVVQSWLNCVFKVTPNESA